MKPLENLSNWRSETKPYIFDSIINLELHVENVELAVSFFESINFNCISLSKTFAVVKFGDAVVLLGKKRNNVIDKSIGELRILVNDIDEAYALVVQRFEDKYFISKLYNAKYGLREFTITSPFGIHIRIATPILNNK